VGSLLFQNCMLMNRSEVFDPDTVLSSGILPLPVTAPRGMGVTSVE
jgi:hypothetical protein